MKISFTHIPRTGGESVHKILKGYIESRGKHRQPKSMGKRVWNNFDFRFTIVRHPYERFISAFSLIQQSYNNSDPELWKLIVDTPKTEAGISSFANEFLTDEKWTNYKDIDTYTDSRRHFLPASYWFNDGFDYDYIGKTENLEGSVKFVYSLAHKKGNNFRIVKNVKLNMVRENSSVHKSWREYIKSPEIKELLYKYYEWDINQFGYDIE
jgi:hypothetical protein